MVRSAAWVILAAILTVGWLGVHHASLGEQERVLSMAAAGVMVLGLCGLMSFVTMAAVNDDNRLRRRQALMAGEARDKFATMVNSIDGVVYEWEPLTEHYEFVSGQIERILGYPPADFTSNAAFWEQTIHPDDREAACAARHTSRQTAQPCRAEYRMKTKDGRWLWLREIGTPCCDGSGRVVLIRGVLIDITPQREAAEELERLHLKVVDASHRAGMAEVATGVLHNVGNVLNSVNVAANLLYERLRDSRVPNLSKVAAMLHENEHRLAGFLCTDERGRMIPRYLEQLAGHLNADHTELNRETQHVLRGIEHIREIVRAQQSTATVRERKERLRPADVIRDAVRLTAEVFNDHLVRVAENFGRVPDTTADRHGLLQILVNLLQNAAHAVSDLPAEVERLVTISLQKCGRDRLCLSVDDNGCGIPQENLVHIFSHGFTTRRDGHGFGLHSSALTAREMGGSLMAASRGPDCGATFTLELPCSAPAHDNSKPAALTPVSSSNYAIL